MEVHHCEKEGGNLESSLQFLPLFGAGVGLCSHIAPGDRGHGALIQMVVDGCADGMVARWERWAGRALAMLDLCLGIGAIGHEVPRRSDSGQATLPPITSPP